MKTIVVTDLSERSATALKRAAARSRADLVIAAIGPTRGFLKPPRESSRR